MRQLHPVSFHEKFVASGTYTFYEGDVPTGDVEYWTVHEPGPGSYTVRSDRDGRSGTGTNWLFEGLYLIEQDMPRLARFDVQLIDAGVDATTRYLFEPTSVEMSALVNGKTLDSRRMPLPAGYVVLPLANVVAYQFARRRKSRAFVPIPAGVLPEHWGGLVKRFAVESLEQGRYEVGGQSVPVTVFRIIDRDTLEESTCWLDDHDVLMYFAGDVERLWLTEYARRPEPKA